jgi:Meckel syndrome type 1 protein
MAERDDAEVARRYRALATEEPSAVLGEAIRAAARRAAASRPGGFRAARWAVPVSAAAVLVLSIGVVLRMQQEEPGIESSLPVREVPEPRREAPAAPPTAPASLEKKAVPAAEPPRPAAPAPAAANVMPSRAAESPAVPGAAAPARAKAEAAAAPAQETAARDVQDTPEKKLERIAELRRDGRVREADEALEKFRREHPDYRIPPEVWERVRPR